MVRKIYRDISVKSFRCATQHRKIIIFISHKYLCDCLHQLVRPNREQYIDIDDKIRIEGSTIQNRLLGQPNISFKIIHYFNYWSQLQKGPHDQEENREKIIPSSHRALLYLLYCLLYEGVGCSDQWSFSQHNLILYIWLSFTLEAVQKQNHFIPLTILRNVKDPLEKC